jgi:hypothetical protein
MDELERMILDTYPAMEVVLGLVELEVAVPHLSPAVR